jgi:hypothetical protein
MAPWGAAKELLDEEGVALGLLVQSAGEIVRRLVASAPPD